MCNTRDPTIYRIYQNPLPRGPLQQLVLLQVEVSGESQVQCSRQRFPQKFTSHAPSVLRWRSDSERGCISHFFDFPAGSRRGGG